MKLSYIQSHGLRFEASVYDLDAMKVRQAVLKNSVSFSNLASSYVCGRFKRVWVGKSDLSIYINITAMVKQACADARFDYKKVVIDLVANVFFKLVNEIEKGSWTPKNSFTTSR